MTQFKVIRAGEDAMLTEEEMWLGVIQVDGVTHGYASDPTVCAVFVQDRWITLSWDAPDLDPFDGDVEQAARYLVQLSQS